MGSVKKAVKKIAKPEIILPIALLAATGGGSAAFGALKGAGLKNILMNQAITAGLSKATTGEIDPKAQLLALGMSGLSGAASTGPFKSAEAVKQFGASSGLSRDASTALAQRLATNPNYVVPQTGLAGLFDKGAQFAKAGFADPLSLKGAVTYGLPAAAGALMGSPKTEEQKKLGVDPQSVYDMGRLYNQKMGGAYTDEELNTVLAPLLSQYGGEYETIVGPQRKRRPMFEGLNYSGLTRLAADGGSIKPKKKSKALKEEQERLDAVREAVIEDMLFSQGINEDVMFDMMRRQELNPTGRAMGGRIGLANGGDLKFAVESFIRDFPEFEDLELKELYKEMEKKGYLSDRDEMQDGGLMQVASAPDPMAERMDMMENIALDKFGKTLDRLTDDEIIQIQEMIENMLPMANGGSIPQTNNVPNDMQIDGRGGGFIPMGARERKDDVPAMLAKNEFVMTADAVRGMGNGDVNEGAQRMYDLMNNLESKV